MDVIDVKLGSRYPIAERNRLAKMRFLKGLTEHYENKKKDVIEKNMSQSEEAEAKKDYMVPGTPICSRDLPEIKAVIEETHHHHLPDEFLVSDLIINKFVKQVNMMKEFEGEEEDVRLEEHINPTDDILDKFINEMERRNSRVEQYFDVSKYRNTYRRSLTEAYEWSSLDGKDIKEPGVPVESKSLIKMNNYFDESKRRNSYKRDFSEVVSFLDQPNVKSEVYSPLKNAENHIDDNEPLTLNWQDHEKIIVSESVAKFLDNVDIKSNDFLIYNKKESGEETSKLNDQSSTNDKFEVSVVNFLENVDIDSNDLPVYHHEGRSENEILVLDEKNQIFGQNLENSEKPSIIDKGKKDLPDYCDEGCSENEQIEIVEVGLENSVDKAKINKTVIEIYKGKSDGEIEALKEKRRQITEENNLNLSKFDEFEAKIDIKSIDLPGYCQEGVSESKLVSPIIIDHVLQNSKAMQKDDDKNVEQSLEKASLKSIDLPVDCQEGVSESKLVSPIIIDHVLQNSKAIQKDDDIIVEQSLEKATFESIDQPVYCQEGVSESKSVSPIIIDQVLQNSKAMQKDDDIIVDQSLEKASLKKNNDLPVDCQKGEFPALNDSKIHVLEPSASPVSTQNTLNKAEVSEYKSKSEDSLFEKVKIDDAEANEYFIQSERRQSHGTAQFLSKAKELPAWFGFHQHENDTKEIDDKEDTDKSKTKPIHEGLR